MNHRPNLYFVGSRDNFVDFFILNEEPHLLYKISSAFQNSISFHPSCAFAPAGVVLTHDSLKTALESSLQDQIVQLRSDMYLVIDFFSIS